MVKGYLKIMVLKTLSKKGMSGYTIIQDIERCTGCWKPSFGSIYPLLEQLVKDKNVIVKKSGRRKIYSLTHKGKKELELLTKKKNEFVDSIIESLRIFETVSGKGDFDVMLEFLNNLKKDKIPFKELYPEIHEFNAILFDLFTKNKISKNKEKIKKIFKKTSQELRKLD